MALPTSKFQIKSVAKPNVGETIPAEVLGEVTITLPEAHAIRREWEGLRIHDVIFLVGIQYVGPGFLDSAREFGLMKCFVGLLFLMDKAQTQTRRTFASNTA